VTPLLALLGLCLLAVTLGYLGWCEASPWGPCFACRGTGRRHKCLRCDGTGMRPRIAHQLKVYFRRAWRDGTR
jgi:DnaJ-class molecular chaperone